MLAIGCKPDKEGSENIREVRDRIESSSGIKRFLKLEMSLKDRN